MEGRCCSKGYEKTSVDAKELDDGQVVQLEEFPFHPTHCISSDVVQCVADMKVRYVFCTACGAFGALQEMNGPKLLLKQCLVKLEHKPTQRGRGNLVRITKWKTSTRHGRQSNQ